MILFPFWGVNIISPASAETMHGVEITSGKYLWNVEVAETNHQLFKVLAKILLGHVHKVRILVNLKGILKTESEEIKLSM